MTDGDALLTAILANPADNTPRLVYADWLQENDQESRAEFIRVQVEIATARHAYETCAVGKHCECASPYQRQKLCGKCAATNRWNDVSETLSKRENGLFNCLYSDNLPGPFVPNLDGRVGRDAPHAHYHRGFVESITCTATDWLTHGDAIRRQHPVTRVKLTTEISITHKHNDAANPHKFVIAISEAVTPLTTALPTHKVTLSSESTDELIRLRQEEQVSHSDYLRAVLDRVWPGVEFEFPSPVSADTFRAITGPIPLDAIGERFRIPERSLNASGG